MKGVLGGKYIDVIFFNELNLGASSVRICCILSLFIELILDSKTVININIVNIRIVIDKRIRDVKLKIIFSYHNLFFCFQQELQ